jgi:hypothetical protein
MAHVWVSTQHDDPGKPRRWNVWNISCRPAAWEYFDFLILSEPSSAYLPIRRLATTPSRFRPQISSNNHLRFRSMCCAYKISEQLASLDQSLQFLFALHKRSLAQVHVVKPNQIERRVLRCASLLC